MLWEDEPAITGTQNYASGVMSHDCMTLKSHGLVNMVVADGLVPIRHQDICNQRGDIGQLDIGMPKREHRKPIVVGMPTCPSLAVSEMVTMATSGTTSGDKVGIMTAHGFNCTEGLTT